MIDIRDFLQSEEGEVPLSLAVEQAVRSAEVPGKQQAPGQRPVVLFPAGQYLVEGTIDLSSSPGIVLQGQRQA